MSTIDQTNAPASAVRAHPSASESVMQRLFVRQRGDAPAKLLVIHAILILYSIISVYPMLRVVSVSLRPNDQLFTSSLAIIPDNASMENYTKLFTEKDFLVWLWNSMIITVTVSAVGVVLSSTSAYAFSRWKFPGRDTGLIFLLTTQMIPAGMLMIPLYLLMFQLKMIDNYWGVLFAYSVTAVPFSIWILKGYYDTIPADLEEAAMIDGASRLGAFSKIILPLSTPSLAIIFLFNFTSAWNEFILARVLLKDSKLFTWPVGLYGLVQQFSTEWGTYAAAAVLIMLPVMVLFLYSSKWLISGLTLGSVKG